MSRELHLLPNGCIVEGPPVLDKHGKLLPRPIVARLSYASEEVAQSILECLRTRHDDNPH